MTLSIVIPVYNSVKYLPSCIDSLQRFREKNKHISCDIVIVDDGSTDGSGELCDSYARKVNGLKIIHQNNSGVSIARNTGLDHAVGDWIWFVDSDDEVVDEAVTIPECDTIFFGSTWFDNTTTKSYPETNDLESEKNDFLQRHYSFLNQTMWFRRDVLERYNIRFTPGVKMGEDLELQYKYLLICSKPVSKTDNLYRYRVVEGSATRNPSSDRNIVKDSETVLKNLLAFIKENNIREEAWFAARLQRMVKTMLLSMKALGRAEQKASHVVLRGIMDGFSECGYEWTKSATMRLAYRSVRCYEISNSIYLKLRNIK